MVYINKYESKSELSETCFPVKIIRINTDFFSLRKNNDIEEDDMEKNYESSHSIHDKEYNTRMLLPIKTKDGVQCRYTDCVDRPEKIIGLY